MAASQVRQSLKALTARALCTTRGALLGVSPFGEEAPVTRSQKVPIASWPILLVILLLAVSRGGLYASLMPPWGLIDEEQHFDYVQSLAERGTIPTVGETYLSPEIIKSLFETQRWTAFHWPTPPSPDPKDMGLEGYSYEGYQPPLYYALLAPLYAVLPGGVLLKLFALRWVTVGLSLLAVWMVYRIASELFPDDKLLPFLAAALLVVIPERTASISRLNNDVLVEVFATALIWVCTRVLLQGLTPRRSLLLGALLGLGFLAKSSMAVLIAPLLVVLWLNRRTAHWLRCTIYMAGVAGLIAAPFVARNLWLYGDLTGMAGFKQITNFAAPSLTLLGVVRAAIDLFRHLWLVWWKGALPGNNIVVLAIHALLALICGLSLLGLWRYRQHQPAQAAGDRRTLVLLVYLVAIGFCALAVLLSYFAGDFPAIQGRFFLPVLAPIVILMSWGLWYVPHGRLIQLATILLLLFADTLSLFANQLPYFYFWSSFFKNGVPQSYEPMPLAHALSLFGTRLLSDKPVGWTLLLTALFVTYGAMLLVAGVVFWRQLRPDTGIRPEPSDADLAQQKPRVPPWVSIRRLAADPLVWTTCALLVLYLLWIAARPQGVFWSLDEGGKLLYIQNTLKTGQPGSPLLYPGRYLDPELEFTPLYYYSQVGDQIFSWWPIGFPLLSLPFYRWLGWMGLYVIPAVSGALCALFAGLLVRRLEPAGTRWLAVGAALITGLATPVAFYSTTFWEHTPAVACLLGATLAVLYGIERKRARWMILAGVLAALGTFLRTEIAGLVVGMGLALLIWYWRGALQFGFAFALSCLPWLLFNQYFMGGFLGRQWNNGAASLSMPLFGGLRQVGWRYVPYALFNYPRIAAYEFAPAVLASATLLVLIAALAPLVKPLRWACLIAYIGLVGICAWVLLSPGGYRSVHGFVLVAPHVVFAAWLYANPADWRRSPFPTVLLTALAVFSFAFLTRGWVAAGGLQWGPRYLLAQYPLLVVASVVGLIRAWPSLHARFKTGLVVLYLAAIAVGFGYELRGAAGAAQTMRYYHQTELAMQQFDTATFATDCTWMPMVIPSLYWQGTVFKVRDPQALDRWIVRARQAEIESAQSLELDLCRLDPLERIAAERAANPSGLTLGQIAIPGAEQK